MHSHISLLFLLIKSLTNEDIIKLKLERVTSEDLSSYEEIDKEAEAI